LKANYTEALNGRCLARAIVGQLEQALADCQRAHSLSGDEAFVLGNLGFVCLKMNEPGPAIADYNAALAANPRRAAWLYGRGLAEQKMRVGGAMSDITAAKAIQPDIADQFAKWGVTLASPGRTLP
jgi:tetratricopeptide (TPR) repeat protein